MKRRIGRTMACLCLAASCFSGCGESISEFSSINDGISTKEKLEYSYEKLELADVFCNGMVIEADKPFSVWGLGKSGECLSVVLKKGDSVVEKLEGKVASDNSFKAELSAVKSSFDEYTLEVSSESESIKIKDILFGKVFFAGGQSNMEWKVSWMIGASDYVSENLNKYVRIYQTESNPLPGGQSAEYPLKPQFFGSDGYWINGSNASMIYNVTALGYVFAVEMFKLYGETVPIGIVNTSVGGTYVENWLSRETIENDESFLNMAKTQGKYVEEKNWNTKGAANYGQMSANYNLKIAPVRFCRFSGVIWYQGENNVTDYGYEFFEKSNEKLAESFKSMFGLTEEPMVAAMIAPRKYFANEELLGSFFESQAKMQNSKILNTGVVAQYDIPVKSFGSGNTEEEYHPADKIPLGKRMAAAMNALEQKKSSGVSPEAKKATYENGKLSIPVFYADGLEKIDESRTESGIELFLKNSWVKVSWDDLSFENGVLSIDSSEKPTYVRYNYTQLETGGNIKNTDGFPMLPFMYRVK